MLRKECWNLQLQMWVCLLLRSFVSAFTSWSSFVSLKLSYLWGTCTFSIIVSCGWVHLFAIMKVPLARMWMEMVLSSTLLHINTTTAGLRCLIQHGISFSWFLFFNSPPLTCLCLYIYSGISFRQHAVGSCFLLSNLSYNQSI